MTNSRAKGARVEREAAEWFRQTLGVHCERTAQRTGKGGTADLRGGLDAHIEVKGGAAWNAYAALEQARRDAAPGRLCVLWAKRDRKPPIVAVYAEDLLRLAEAVMARTKMDDGLAGP